MPTATNDRRAYIRRRPVEVAVNDGASRVLGLGFLFVAAMGPNLDCDEIFKADSTGEVCLDVSGLWSPLVARTMVFRS